MNTEKETIRLYDEDGYATEFSGTVKSSIGLGILLREGIGDTLRVSLSDDPVKEIKVAKEILKDCNLYKGVPTLVACPTCGRTQIDLIPIAKEVEEFLQTINTELTVAVMGCAVNGPGEARNADIGIGEVPYMPKQVMYLCADINKLTKDTGFVPEWSFEEGIKETVEWCRKQRNGKL